MPPCHEPICKGVGDRVPRRFVATECVLMRRVAMPPNSSDAGKICTGPISIFRSLCCQAEAQINYRRALPLVVLSQGQKALAIKQNPCFKPGAPALKTDICGSRAHAQII